MQRMIVKRQLYRMSPVPRVFGLDTHVVVMFTDDEVGALLAETSKMNKAGEMRAMEIVERYDSTIILVALAGEIQPRVSLRQSHHRMHHLSAVESKVVLLIKGAILANILRLTWLETY